MGLRAMIRKTRSDADGEWWRGAVIYQIYPRSFYDGNSDGVGDLAGIAEKLPYVASLGVDAVWIAPFFRSPMADFGYDVADHRAVDPIFGSLDDFDRLIARAHALGLRVIIDQVWGHTSDANPWFRESAASRGGDHADWYIWADPKADGTPPNNWLAVFGGSAWSWSPRRRQYYLHHFLSCQPTLNLRHPPVMAALLETARFWLDRGVDGFRLDAIDFLLHDPALRDDPARPPADGVVPAKPFGLQEHLYDMVQPEVSALLGACRRRLAEDYPGTALLGEVSSQDGAFGRIARYTTAGEGLHMAYTLRPLRRDAAASAIGDALAEIEAVGGDGWLCWAFSNHDVERAASRWNPARVRDELPPRPLVRMLLTLLVALRGSVCLYQGEELGLGEALLDCSELRDPFGIAYHPVFPGRDGCRTPMPWRSDAAHAGFTRGEPWLPVPREHFIASVADQEADPDAPLNLLRRLLAWRKAHGAVRCGSLVRLDPPAPLLGFERVDAGERLLFLFNPSERPATLSLRHEGLRRILDEVSTITRAGDAIVFPPYGVLVAELEAADRARQDKRRMAALIAG